MKGDAPDGALALEEDAGFGHMELWDRVTCGASMRDNAMAGQQCYSHSCDGTGAA
jgi:hypothetical protein